MHHHHGCGCENHAQREGGHHYHEGCGCPGHTHPPVAHHGSGCHHHGYPPRHFPTREETIRDMGEYLKQLQAEAKEVEERLAEMKKADE